MTTLDSTDDRFITERKARQRFGMLAFPAAIVLVLLVWIGMFSFVPLLVNPFDVLGRLETQTLAPGTLTVFAVVGVLAMNAVFLLTIALSVLGIVIAQRERRYLKLIDKLRAPVSKSSP
jgi:protein-S-isoprenylcysteine O-methyltransferase Ste14